MTKINEIKELIDKGVLSGELSNDKPYSEMNETQREQFLDDYNIELTNRKWQEYGLSEKVDIKFYEGICSDLFVKKWHLMCFEKGISAIVSNSQLCNFIKSLDNIDSLPTKTLEVLNNQGVDINEVSKRENNIFHRCSILVNVTNDLPLMSKVFGLLNMHTAIDAINDIRRFS